MKGNYVCLVLSLDLQHLIECLAHGKCPMNRCQVREEWQEGGMEGGKKEGASEGGGEKKGRKEEGGREGRLTAPAVQGQARLDWITDYDLGLLGCTPAPHSLLQPPLPQ